MWNKNKIKRFQGKNSIISMPKRLHELKSTSQRNNGKLYFVVFFFSGREKKKQNSGT